MKINIDLPTLQLEADIPTTWNEMTAAQCAHILKIFALPLPFMASAKESFRWKQMQIFKALTDWTDENIEAWQAAQIAEDGEDGIMLFLQDFQTLCEKATQNLILVDENTEGEETYQLAPTLTQNPYKKIEIAYLKDKKMQFTTLYAPKSTQENPLSLLSLDELTRVFTLWETYRDDKSDPSVFDEMLAILYRPKKSNPERMKKNYNGDVRQKLEENEALVKSRAKLIGTHVSENMRVVLDFHIASCRDAIATMYPSVFGRKGQPSKGKTGDWLDVIIALADDDFSKKETVMLSNAHDSLAWADRIRETMKQQIKDAQN